MPKAGHHQLPRTGRHVGAAERWPHFPNSKAAVTSARPGSPLAARPHHAAAVSGTGGTATLPPQEQPAQRTLPSHRTSNRFLDRGHRLTKGRPPGDVMEMDSCVGK